MAVAYHHVDETFVRAPARSCYELVLAVRRYGQWWKRVRCEPLGTEGELRLGSRFRLSGGPVAWEVEVTGLQPWRQIDLEYAAGDLLGPVRWEFRAAPGGTRVSYAYRGVRPNSAYTEASFASGRSLRIHTEAMQNDAFAGMRLILERGPETSRADLFEAIHTLGAVRQFRPDPVDDATLVQVIAAATRAASARNAEPWAFVAVRSAEQRERIGRLYLEAWEQAKAYTASTHADADIEERRGYGAMMESVDDLARHIGEAPVLVLACLDTRRLGPLADGAGQILSPQSAYASIFPAVQNLMLAAHSLGLGTTLTTVFRSAEARLRAVLDIPDHVHVAALLPLGYPLRPFRPARRRPVSEVLFLDRWGERLEVEPRSGD
jgi:nitroreductase